MLRYESHVSSIALHSVHDATREGAGLGALLTDECECVAEVGRLDVGEEVDQRLEVAVVRGFEGVEVRLAVFLVTDHEHQVLAPQEHGRRQCARDSAVAVLEGVYLRESVMQPGSLDLWAHALGIVLCVPRDETIDLVLHELGRAVLVDAAIGADGVVRQPLPLTLAQRCVAKRRPCASTASRVS